jgi:glutaryl-CoA dehydrogenase
MWISNAPFADIAVVWAMKEGRFMVDCWTWHGRFTTPETHNKWSLRASSTGELFDNVKVPKKIFYQ